MVHGRTLHAELDSGKRGGQVTIGPQLLAADGVAGGVAQHDVSGQALVLRAQRVADPAAHHGPAREDLAGEQHVERFQVIVVLGVHAANEA